MNDDECIFISFLTIQGRTLRRVSGASYSTNSVDIQAAGDCLQNTGEQGQDWFETWQPGKA